MSNILGPPSGLNEILDAMTQEIINDRSKEPSKYSPLRPSSAGKCEKELGYEYMEFKGYERYERTPNTPEVHRLLNLGNSIEKHLIWEMEAGFKKLPTPLDIKYKQQSLSLFRLNNGTMIEGNLDLVLMNEKFKMIVDVKSKGSKFSQWHKSTWEEFAEKLEKLPSVTKFGGDAFWIEDLSAFVKESGDPFFNQNLLQLNVYACSDFIRERGIDCAAIIQYNKVDSRLREVRFKPSQEMFDYVRNKFTRVAEVIEATKDPENLTKEFVLGSAKCGFCPFNKQCWPDVDALKEHFKTYPKKSWPKDLDRLPKDAQAQLTKLFNDYHALVGVHIQIERIEEEIIGILDKLKVWKIRLSTGEIYRMKQLKSGGVKDGPRLVLRRDKL